MSRLIDADALLTTMEVMKCPMENDLDSFMAGMRAVLERICDAPTVDAVPVVHGHWEIVPNDKNKDGYYKMRCSACGATLWSIEPEELYCCKCGAKMDGADEERSENGEVR